ncbi:MAG: ATP synthase subunit I [Gammaproteobacteria bacterium]|nr:ATP synthase subunit I [Gammaproteobacteria bacterium]
MITRTPPRGEIRGPLRERARHAMRVLLVGQLVIAALVVLVLAVWPGPAVAYSAMVGALIAIVPNWYLANRLTRRGPGATPDQALRGIYTGELLKIAFTIALFVIAIRLLDVAFLIVVASYLAMVVVNWAALLFIDLGEAPRVSSAGSSS